MIAQKNKTVVGLTSGIESLFKKYKVKYEKGHGRFNKSKSLDVLDAEGKVVKTLKAR